MAQKKKTNPLDFTGLDYDSIRNKIQTELDKDPRFETFRDSSIAKTILDMFAGTTDITNYYIERRAEEQFFDTARLKSSVIALSRILGYTPTRPIPAVAGLNIVLKGPLSPSLSAGDTVTFQKYDTTFTGDGKPFMLKNTYKYTFTADDITGGAGIASWTKEVRYGVNVSASDADIPIDTNGNIDSRLLLDIELLQGEKKVETIYGSQNPQVGQLFQKYKVNDKTVSNYYGEEDLGFNSNTLSENLSNNLTKMGIGSTQANALASDNLFKIRRKSLIDPTEIDTETLTVPNVVLFLTNMDEGITLYFGDNLFASKGLNSQSNNIYVQYFSTLGARGNKVGVIGDTITSPNTFESDGTAIDLTNNIKFKFATNIKNGTDMESIDSIKLNAPEIYYSLDRLVTSRDYVSYLKSQTIGDSGGQIKNAKAWGEQEEIKKRGQLANFRFFNCMFFTVLGELYNFVSKDYNIKNDTQLHDSFLEEAEDFSTVTESSTGVVSADGYPEQSYFNILVKGQPQTEIKRVEDFRNISSTHPISRMYTKLEKRAQTTVRPLYISPIVQKFKLKGRVTIGALEDRNEVRRKINNNIYTWLNDNADFEVDIQKSPIIDIISNETKEVKSTNVYFEPVRPVQLITTFASDPDIANGSLPATSATLISTINTEINTYLTSAGFANVRSNETSANSSLLSIYDVPSVSGATLVTSASTLPTSTSTTPGIWNNPYSDGNFPDFWYEYKAHVRVGNISEYTFYNTLIKNIYNAINTAGLLDVGSDPYEDSQYFKNLVYKLHNDLTPVIRTSMLDDEGNINIYSLGNEVAQVEVSLSYVYETE